MKKLFIFFTFFLFIPTLLNVYSCGFNQEKEGYFPEKENMIDISTIESDIKEPLPLSNKEVYKKSIQKLIEDKLLGTKLNVDYAIIFNDNGNDFFEVNDDVYINAIKTSKLIYSSKPIRKVVDFISLTTYEDNIDLCKPRTGENIKSSLIKFSACIEKIIINTKNNTDFKITYESQKEDIWSKNDIVYINYIPFSKVLRGSIQFKLILLDLSTLDYSDVIPRNNQTKDKVKLNIINKIKKHSRNAEFNKDFYIEINSKTKLLKDGDIVTLYADPNSNMINGEKQQFIVKTFNLNDVKQDFYKLNYKFNTSKEDIKNQLNSLLYSLIPEAKIDIDYKIEIENKYSVLYPGDKIKVKPVSSSEYIIGNQIVLETPKLDIDFITKEIKNIKISIGNTNKDNYKKEVYENIQNIFKEIKVLDELTFNFSKSKEFIVGDEEITIKANLNSKFFLQNNKSIKIKTNKYNSKDVKKFLDNFLFTGLENSINITAGLQKEEVSKIINSLLSSSNDFKNLKENRDFKLEFQNSDKYLKSNQKFNIVVLKDSDFLEGNSFSYNIIDYDIKVMKPSFDEIKIKEGEYKKDINNKIKEFITTQAPFINFEKDIEIKYTREVKENNSQDPNNGLGEDKELLTKNEKVEFILKKNPLLTSKEQTLELLTIKSTNHYVDLSYLNNFNKVDFISDSSNSNLQAFEYEIIEEYLKILKNADINEIKEFKDYLSSSFGSTVKDFAKILQINWYVKEKDSKEEWRQIENNYVIKENEMYMVKISFEKELYCQFLKNNFKVYNEVVINVNIILKPDKEKIIKKDK